MGVDDHASLDEEMNEAGSNFRPAHECDMTGEQLKKRACQSILALLCSLSVTDLSAAQEVVGCRERSIKSPPTLQTWPCSQGIDRGKQALPW